MTDNPALAIETHELVKVYGETRALDGLDLTVRTGTIHGVLGPNGAGKTTAMKILATLLRPTSGKAQVLGHDVVREASAVRRRIGLTGQTMALDEDMTGLQNLILASRLQGLRHRPATARAEELLEAFELTEVGGRLVKTYSGGQKRRIDVAASMVVTHEVLFLDEPTTGLDPRSRSDVWQMIRVLVRDGGTVVLTTQYLDEADQMADDLTLIDHGRVVARGTPAELKTGRADGVLEVLLTDSSRRAEAGRLLTRAIGAGVAAESDPSRLLVKIPDADQAARALGELARAGISVEDFTLGQPTLDTVFLALTGHSTVDKPREEEAEVRA
ncbi:daunorubicin resistance protein DrrA family ABC transporter ATP-binding protein [Salinispora arenicola]|uniref:daunorubicin resistance protein DrrA family ABC transporter ATP-binding protein n=1 Tax=Salinispora arenicola TaxID=168697 RepID=UPI00037F23EB|nr:daunorubicin resistance protein DrrA family ABC transporter ATP-binding protein [Salinispora arenicola]NIL58461.1 daunorubicin resistance protein DrrA family ABC transporter ATP-binding protein [Salinispora arenicola]NIL62921.1 daunorubicin resistance protein DrrA family ABC transporter ATP-binding protein [Salinispora arenicola]